MVTFRRILPFLPHKMKKEEGKERVEMKAKGLRLFLLTLVPIAGMAFAVKNEKHRTQHLKTTGYPEKSKEPLRSTTKETPSPPAAIEGVPAAMAGPVIKAKTSSGIYHVPGGRYYDGLESFVEFTSEQEAIDAGYRKSKR